MFVYRKLALVLALAVSFVLVGGSTASAQHTATHDANVGNLLSGLINVNVGDINVEDVVTVNVDDTLNENEVRILNNVLNNNEVASRNQDVLNDLLRNADIITDNQVVVGVLSGGQVVVQDVVQ